MMKFLITILLLISPTLVIGQNAQVNPVAALDQPNTAVVNNNFQNVQTGLNGIFGLFSRYFTNGYLNTASGGTGTSSAAWTTGSIPYMTALGTWGNIGIGTTGQVLTVAAVPVWQNLPSQALTFISNTSFSAVHTSGSIAITNTEFYKVNFWIRTNTAASALWLRFNTDSGANYNYAFDGRTTGGAITGGASAAAKIILNTSTLVSTYISGELYIYPQQGTSDPLYVFGKLTYTDTAGTLLTYVDVSGNWIPSTPANATSFAIIDDGGGATLTGNVYLYKYSKS